MYQKYIHINPFTIVSLLILLLHVNPLSANTNTPSESTLILPVSIDLDNLKAHLNDTIPQTLSIIDEPDKVCVEAKYLKTKGIPKIKIHGYKISSEDRWIRIKTTPEIKCDIKGWVKRDGSIELSGKDNTLKIAFPIKAKVSIDTPIDTVAEASAIIYIHATPRLNDDWSVSVDVSPHFSWSEKPTAKVLDLIKLSIQSQVEPKLRKKMNTFVKKIPKLIEALDIKEKVNTVWNEIQEPFKIHEDSELYLLFKPKTISCSGLSIIDNKIQTTLCTKGKTEILLGKPDANCKKTKLCKLESISSQQGKFNFNLPVSITYQELLSLSKKRYLDEYSLKLMKSALPGLMKISNPKIEKSPTGKIRISAHINYDNRSTWLKAIDIFNWFDVDGEITFTGSPHIDKSSRSLVFNNLSYDSTTNSDLFDALVDASELQPLQSYFANLMKYDFGEKIDKSIDKANHKLKEFSKDYFNVSANLHIASIENIILNETMITIHTKLSGIIDAHIKL